jgi:uncharacterized protein (DUF608 family)
MKTLLIILLLLLAIDGANCQSNDTRQFNSVYKDEYLNRISFPIGGIGAGMICLDGNGAFSHVSLRNKPDLSNTPFMFAAISVKGINNGAKILEGPVQSWKIFRDLDVSNNINLFGCPRFEKASFSDRFPFGTVSLSDLTIPMEISITGWSPFVPTDADNSSLPAGCLEYTFKNTSGKDLEAVFSFNSENFMRIKASNERGSNYVGKDSIMQMDKGFILEQPCLPGKPYYKGEFAFFTDEPGAVIDYCWFRGSRFGQFDSKTVLWKNIETCNSPSNPVSKGASGASLYVPFKLKPNELKTINVHICWYVPHTDIRIGWDPESEKSDKKPGVVINAQGSSGCSPDATSDYYEPWYSGKFADIKEVAKYWRENYKDLKTKSELFSNTFYSSDLPPEVLEAIAANLTILKSPTVLRQKDGKLWGWEGCHLQSGSWPGSCTHVWNYAQAIPHLFPKLERSLRETEFIISQNQEGHQNFRASLPIREPNHSGYAASDGQLGGIMKLYRDWRISGDNEWLKKLWPQVKLSMDYCINQWDPRHTGTVEEPHHNTYDIEFWGADAMCTSFYIGALTAYIKMSDEMGDDSRKYKDILSKGKKAMESELFNGEYFIQKVKWEGLSAPSPVEIAKKDNGTIYSKEALNVIEKEGPNYQYGSGCLSDGVLGGWIAKMCGLGDILDQAKIKSHLAAVYKYDLKFNLSNEAYSQRAGFAYGKEGGLLLCSWPKGGQPKLPMIYSNLVWTGIEYQVASHLMLMGEVENGLQIVQEARKRYDGRTRNPFDENEAGHWYARAMSSYGLIQGLTGIQYDAVDKTLYIDSKIGDNFKCFICTETGFGLAGLKKGKPFIEVKYGHIDVTSAKVSGNPSPIEIINK